MAASSIVFHPRMNSAFLGFFMEELAAQIARGLTSESRITRSVFIRKPNGDKSGLAGSIFNGHTRVAEERHGHQEIKRFAIFSHCCEHASWRVADDVGFWPFRMWIEVRVLWQLSALFGEAESFRLVERPFLNIETDFREDRRRALRCQALGVRQRKHLRQELSIRIACTHFECKCVELASAANMENLLLAALPELA